MPGDAHPINALTGDQNENIFDCEFTGLHQKTTLISLGAISENGQQFYAEFSDYDRSQLDDWLYENVISNLSVESFAKPGSFCDGTFYGDHKYVVDRLTEWLNQFEVVEMWSDCLAYDWVLFCELFGGGIGCLPRNVYYIPFDLCTLLKVKGIDPDIQREDFAGLNLESQHNALHDAQVIKACYEKVMLVAPFSSHILLR